MVYDLRSIGFVRNKIQSVPETPWGEVASTIEVLKEFQEGLKGLDLFSHALVVCWLDRVRFDRERHLVRRPFRSGEYPEVGVFARRASERPNPIVVTAVKIDGIKGNRLQVRGLDAFDGTPVVDIKPYNPLYDTVADPRVPDWVEKEQDRY